MSDERQASEHARELLHTLDHHTREADRKPLPRAYSQWVTALNALADYIADLEADRALLETAVEYYVAVDFTYFEKRPCLILALPQGAHAGADLRKTLAAMSSSPLAPTQEGA